jgi:hypothetical protein
MVMRTFLHIFAAFTSLAVLWLPGSPARAAEPAQVPSFHHVLVINNTPRAAALLTEAGLLTAAMETQQADGQWRGVATLRAPIGINPKIVFRAGEIWQFIVPGSGRGVPAKARLALGVAGGVFYSQPFEVNVDPSSSGQIVDCWLARIQPAQSEHRVVITVADKKRRD